MLCLLGRCTQQPSLRSHLSELRDLLSWVRGHVVCECEAPSRSIRTPIAAPRASGLTRKPESRRFPFRRPAGRWEIGPPGLQQASPHRRWRGEWHPDFSLPGLQLARDCSTPQRAPSATRPSICLRDVAEAPPDHHRCRGSGLRRPPAAADPGPSSGRQAAN